MLVDSLDAAIRGLSNPVDGLAPAEVLFDALANHLANAITDVPRGAAVDRAAALMRVVARDVWRHLTRSAVAHVVSLVGAERLGVTTRHAVEQAQCTRAFAETVGVAGPCLDQRAIHREVFSGEQPLLVGQTHDFGKERFEIMNTISLTHRPQRSFTPYPISTAC
ncbi:hypothetical protein WS86_22600 [Burkholderia savannae]|nr:hypothetical protein WS86_22600 [Burkholderia savannae]